MPRWMPSKLVKRPRYFPGASRSILRIMENTFTETEVQAARTKAIPKGRLPCKASSMPAMISSALLLAESSILKLW